MCQYGIRREGEIRRDRERERVTLTERLFHMYRVVFPEENPKKRKHPDSSVQEGLKEDRPVLLVTPYTIPNRGPYPYNQPKRSLP